MLIDIGKKKIASEEEEKPLFGSTQIVNQQSIVFQNSKLLEAQFPKLEKNTLYDYVSHGSFAKWQLLYHILLNFYKEPVKIYVSSWTITEEPARRFVQLMQRGIISELHILLDHRAKMRKDGPVGMIRKAATAFGTALNHAKVIVIDSEEMPCTIVCSQNLTGNPRTEAGTITTFKSSAEFHKEWINDLIQKSKKPLLKN
jgi:hypothetical protein